MKQGFKIAVLVLVIVASFTYAIQRSRMNRHKGPPNILVVSFCSFHMKRLSRYGGEHPELLPAMELFMKNASFIFDNVYNGMPWTGVFTFTRERIPVASFRQHDYHFLGSMENGHAERIPFRHSLLQGNVEAETNDNDFEKDVGEVTDYLKGLVLNPLMRPFFLIAHYKYLHYPFIDRLNADSDWDRDLSVRDRNQIAEYLNHPEKYPEKLPFLMLLANDPNIAYVHPEIVKLKWQTDPHSMRKLTGLLANPHFVQVWKESSGFKEDMRMLEAVYGANIKYLDAIMAGPLELWGNKDLQDNTVVIMMGDHGEMHMERGELTHSAVLYDEALHVPMAIHFPEHWGATKIIQDQMHFISVAKLIEGIVKGEINESNLPEKVKTLGGDTVVLRDCLNSLRGIRVRNQYKYFVNILSGERFLFNLEKDPGELHNLASEQPELADEFEALYWEKYPDFTGIFPYHCAAWGSTPKIMK